MALFAREVDDPELPRGDRGRGSFDDYRYNLRPKNRRVTMTLAASDPCQDELARIVEVGGELETAISPRSIEQERVDAPIDVRLFSGSRVSAPVGRIPRGLESVIDDTLRRLDDAGQKPRIPARIVSKGGALRVQLLMGSLI